METPEAQPDADLTQLLEELRGADQNEALSRLMPAVYAELRRLSEAYLRQERPDHTLQATALVHEAYVRMAKGKTVHYRDRAHFFRVAARIMRRILVNYARGHNAQKRGGGARPIRLEEATMALPDQDFTLVDLDEVLHRLGRTDPQKGRIVELRFFTGCTIEETAEALGISTATVERDWRFARAWLYRELESSAGP